MGADIDVSKILQDLYGLRGTIKPLPGEFDRNFHVTTDNANEYLLKISHPEEKLAAINLQNAVLQYLQSSVPSLHFPKLNPTLHGDSVGLVSNQHYVRLFTYVPGDLLAHVDQSPELLESVGYQLGYLCQALHQFKNITAQRYLKWDLKQASWIREYLTNIIHSEERECLDYFLNRFETQTATILANLRHSVIHGDLNDYNIVVSNQRVSGLIDFGDVVETATICELAIALTYIMLEKPDPIAVASKVIKCYHQIFPLEETEIDLLFDLICIRLCMSVVNSAIRKQENPNDAYLIVSEKPAWKLLKTLRSIHPPRVINQFRKACHYPEKMSKVEIKNLRHRLISKNLSLSYRRPLQIVRGSGQYLYDENGKQYLDCINNVAHVGHCHPKVVAAGNKQMATLNTNTRYLDENLVRYAERLTATLPKPLEVCFFVCSGSEANELAIRLAQTYTNQERFLVMDHAYHGNTSTLINISPYKFKGPGGRGKPDFVEVLPIPTNQKENLELKIGANLAAFLCESLLSCGGQIVLPNGYLQQVYTAVRNQGGVCIADEIQVGLGRLGSHFWGFETQDVIPDIVTVGKPLGNGYPMAAVITTKEIADTFNNGMEYFNSFGGSTVACAIGLAVLDVIKEENLQSHALQTGEYLKQQLILLANKHACIKEVRGMGLFLGIEFMSNPNTTISGKDFAGNIVNHMQERGILLSTDGPLQNVIKIKPPLVFTKENGDKLVANLDDLLSANFLIQDLA